MLHMLVAIMIFDTLLQLLYLLFLYNQQESNNPKGSWKGANNRNPTNPFSAFRTTSRTKQFLSNKKGTHKFWKQKKKTEQFLSIMKGTHQIVEYKIILQDRTTF